MKKLTLYERIDLWLLLALLAPLVCAAQGAQPELPQLPVRGYILMDFDSGRVIAEHRATEPLEPASITKVMSAYVIYEQIDRGAIDLNDLVYVSENAHKMIGSRMFIEPNSRVSVADLLLGVVVQSGNDATVALAEHVAGSEAVFAQMMNENAAKLGLSQTHFVNSTGLPAPEHLTTALDIAKLVRALIRDHPEHYATYSIKEYTYNSIKQANRNGLLWRDDSVDGVKTGHTESAGFCLAASAKRDDMRLISVVLGATSEPDRLSASKQLLDYGFRFYQTFRLYEAGQALTEVPVWEGAKDQLSLIFDKDVFVTIPRGRYQHLQASLELPTLIKAPVHPGQALGQVNITLDGQILAKPSLLAKEEIPLGGFIDRLFDGVTLKVRSWLE